MPCVAFEANTMVGAIPSSTIEDMFNDPTGCVSGTGCSGCEDDDGIGSVVDCETFAAFACFTESAWSDMQAACPSADETSCDGGSWTDGTDSLSLNAEEECLVVEIDSRACEDAINNSSSCQSGSTCTGCADSDNRDDGVDCDEIAAYSHVGSTAAQALYEPGTADGSCGDPEQVVEGVALSSDEADAMVAVANGATETVLDDEAGLDSRAAANIVAGRPYSSIDEVADVSYVGGHRHRGAARLLLHLVGDDDHSVDRHRHHARRRGQDERLRLGLPRRGRHHRSGHRDERALPVQPRQRHVLRVQPGGVGPRRVQLWLHLHGSAAQDALDDWLAS